MPNLAPITAEVRMKAKGFLAKTYLIGRALVVHAKERRSLRIMAFECVCAFAILYGISYYSVPIALIIGGLGGILAAERQ